MERMFQVSILSMVKDVIERTCQKKTCQHVEKSDQGNCGHDS